MKNKDYQKPTMEVVEAEVECHILVGSGVGANRSGYGTAQEETWDNPASSSRGNNVWDNEKEQD